MKNKHFAGFILLPIVIVCISIACSKGRHTKEPPPEIDFTPIIAKFTEDEQKALNAVKDGTIFDVLGKNLAKKVTVSEFKETEKKVIDYANSKVDKDIALKLLLNEHFLDSVMDDFDPPVIAPVNLNSLIESGVLGIIPRNPYTDEDIKSSLDYSPGDFLIAVDNEALVWIEHMGPNHFEFDSEFTEYNYLKYIDYDEKFGEDTFYLTDGRSKYTFTKGKDYFHTNMETLRKKFGDENPFEIARYKWLLIQMGKIIDYYCRYNTELPDNLDDMINHCGRKNPAAWINPYTGKPIEQMDNFPECKNLHEDAQKVDHLSDISEIPMDEYIRKYAGNFTYEKIKLSQGNDLAILSFYILDDGELVAINVDGTSVLKS